VLLQTLGSFVVASDLCCANGDGTVETETDHGFRGDVDLLTAGEALHGRASATAYTGPDGSALASAEDASDDGTNCCATANLFCTVFASPLALKDVGL